MKIDQVPERYRRRIIIDDHGCWLWTGAKHRRGYGMVNICRKVVTTHAFLFELLVGPVPVGMQLHHKCQVSACCNPDHLRIVTPIEHGREHRHTHCQRGHELTPENVALQKSTGYRQCRICKNEAHSRFLESHPGYANPYKRAYKLKKKLYGQ